MNERDVERMHDDLLDEIYPSYTIAGVTLMPSQILKETDPVAYRQSLLEYEGTYGADSEEEEEVGENSQFSVGDKVLLSVESDSNTAGIVTNVGPDCVHVKWPEYSVSLFYLPESLKKVED